MYNKFHEYNHKQFKTTENNMCGATMNTNNADFSEENYIQYITEGFGEELYKIQQSQNKEWTPENIKRLRENLTQELSLFLRVQNTMSD